MSERKKTPRIVGLLGKSRDELSVTGSTAWFSIFPGSRREGDDWVPDGSKPFRLLCVKNRVKTWFEPLDVKALLNLLEENKADVDAGFMLAGIALESKHEREKKLLED